MASNRTIAVVAVLLIQKERNMVPSISPSNILYVKTEASNVQSR